VKFHKIVKKNPIFSEKLRIVFKRAENMKFHKFVKKNVKNPIFTKKFKFVVREQKT